MSRPPLDIGTHGAIRYLSAKSGFVARTLFRDFDGRTKQVERWGKTKGQAERKLKRALKERSGSTGDVVTSETLLRDVATLWLADVKHDVANGNKSPGTANAYESVLNRCVLPGIGELRVREVSVSRVDQFLGAVASSIGVPTAKTARSVVSAIMGYAVRYGATDMNPVRDTRLLSNSRKNGPRALTREEREQWLRQLEGDNKAVRWGLPDLSRFLMATGVRIGEALALYWEDVDLASGAVDIKYTIIRLKGEGLVRKSTKTAAGDRQLPLPTWAAQMLAERWQAANEQGEPENSPVFANVDGGLRDPSNTRRVLREVRGTKGFAWVTSHVFRKTAATVLDDSGLSARQIADQLGHAQPSMTQDVYLGRKLPSRRAADALEDVLDDKSG